MEFTIRIRLKLSIEIAVIGGYILSLSGFTHIPLYYILQICYTQKSRKHTICDKEKTTVGNEKSKIFEPLLETFENPDIKSFAKACINTIPDYFWNVGASSTGKYHPKYALGDLGLARHTCAVVRFLNHILSIDCYKNDFTARERDLLRVAGIMHDSRKSGNDTEFARNKYTKFDHPILAADVVRAQKGLLPESEIELVADTIESHMGQWNKDLRSGKVLPLPKTKYQKILHLADYLASRKDIEVLFEGYQAPLQQKSDAEEYVFNFGKHNGEKLGDVAKNDPGYIAWAKNNITREPIRSLLAQL